MKRSRCGGLDLKMERGVAWLRLARPQAGNRIDEELAYDLCETASALELDDAVHVVMLSANGRHFCLGVERPGLWEARADWVDAVATLTKPVVAVIQGDAIAEGLELALACDFHVVSRKARFSMPQVTEGRLPSHGGTQRLPRLCGRARALDMLLTGRVLGAAQAAAWGIATRVVTPARLESAAIEVASTLTQKGPVALRYAKEAILKGADLTLQQGMRLEEDLYALLQTTADRKAGIKAFLKRQQPVFRGT